ncbi:MAG: hypothetical protein ACOYM3_23080 [Terrimicrobiaceae bacterium]
MNGFPDVRRIANTARLWHPGQFLSRVTSCLVVLTGFILNTAYCQPERPLRVAVFASEDSETTALVTKELSGVSGISLIGPGQIRSRLGGKASCDTAPQRLALARSLEADLLILVDSKQNVFAWIDCSTGEELFRIREESASRLARSAFLLVEEQTEVLAEDRKKLTPSGSGISPIDRFEQAMTNKP